MNLYFHPCRQWLIALGALATLAPVFDVFADKPVPPTITVPPQDLVVITGGAASFSVTATGTAPLSYQWRMNGAPIPGATAATYSLAMATTNDAAGYDVIVANSRGSATSEVATLTVYVPPWFTVQPTSLVVTSGDRSVFTAGALGIPTPALQWFFGTSALAGQVSSTLSLTNVQLVEAGSYYCVAANAAGAVTSTVVTLTVLCPSLTVSPTTLPGGVVGSAYKQALTASGGLVPYTFAVAAGALPAGLSLSGAGVLNGQPATIGTSSFTVTATDNNGCTGSQSLTLTVVCAPVTLSPASLPSGTAGYAYSQGLSASGSLGPYSFAVTAGTLPAGLSLSGAGVLNGQPATIGTSSFTVTATDNNGCTGSQSLTLTVVCAPVTLSPASLPSGTAGYGYSQGLSASGGLGAYSFAVTAGTLPAGLSLSGAGVLSGTPSVIGTNSFTVAATDTNGCTGSQVCSLTVTGVPPAITLQPQSRTNAAGTAATLGVTATGTQPLSYQWQLGGVSLVNDGRITGATTSTLEISSVQPGDAGDYTLVVSNVVGVVTSAVATLTVTGPPTITVQPVSVSALAGADVSFSVSASGTPPLSYQWEFNGADIGGASGTGLLLTHVQPTNAGNYTVVVTNGAGSVVSAVATLIVNLPAACLPSAAGLVAWWPGDGNASDIASTNNGVLEGGATANAAGVVGSAFDFDGTNAYVQIPDAPALKPTNLTVEAWVTFSGLNSARSGTAPAGDQYIVFKQNSQAYSFEGYSLEKFRVANGDAFMFTVSSASGQTAVLLSTTLVSTSVWYHVAAERGSNFVQLYVNGQLESQTNVSFAQDYGTLPLYFGTSGETYWDGKFNGRLDEVSLYNRALFSNEVAAIYAAGAAGKCKGASLVTQPQSQTVAAGSNMLFTVTATGARLLSYQWQFNGASIAGASNTSLVLTDVQTANAGSYTVVVTNSLGSVTSAPAVLTVLDLAITTQPVSQTNIAGTTAVFSVVALGTTPAYQWLKNGAPISGATNMILSLTNVSSGDAGSYSVTVSSVSGSLLSSNATLAVFYVPTANNDSYGVAAGTTLTVPAPGVLGNDTVAGGGNLTATLVSGPIHGTLSLNSDGGFTHTPFPNYVGTDSFAYQAVNGPANSGVATVTISITADGVLFADDFTRLSDPAPLSPWVAQSGNWAVTGGALTAGANPIQSYGYAYIANSWTNYSVEGQIQFSSSNAWGGGIGGRLNPATGAHYAAWVYPEGSPGGSNVIKLLKFQTWTSFGYNGTSGAAMAEASLAEVGTNWHTVKLAFYANQIAVYCDGNQVLSVTDEEAQPYLGGGVSVDAWTYSLPYTMSVSKVIVRPLVVDDSYSGAGDTVLTVAAPGVLGNDTGVYATNLEAVLVSGPANGTLNLSANGGFTYSPATNYSGRDSFSYQANQGLNDLGTARVTLTVMAPGVPVILQAPLSQTNAAGTTTAFSAGAVGILPLSYQWQFNGASIAGATSTSLTLNDVQPANAGSYTVVVTNSAGSATSAVAVLTVLPGARTLLINGAQTYQVIDGFGVNANSGSWTNNDLQPVLDALIDQAGMTLFLAIFVGNCNWEATNANPGATLTNWTYFDSVFSGPNFQQLWGMMAYLNQRGITNGLMPKFAGPMALWMGGQSLTPGYENAYAEMLASALVYARQTQNLQFTVVPPLNEPDITQKTGVHLSGPSQYVTVVDDLGQELDANGMSEVRFSGPELATTETSWMATMMGDSYLMSKLAHFGLHSYVGETPDASGVYSFIQQSAYPNTHFWMNEFSVWCPSCLNGAGGNDSWTNAQGIAAALLNHLANGASAGLAFEAYDGVYNGYNATTGQDVPGTWGFWGLFAVDDINAVNRTYTPRKQFYTLSQITKYVRPGALRIDVSGASTPLTVLAFYNTNNGQFTLTGVNTGSSASSLSCALTSLPAIPSLDLYYTSSTTNLCYGGSVALTNDAFSVVVPADCVFTLTYSNTVAGRPAPPAITQQPQSQAVMAASNALFAVTATGATPLSYQWQLNGLNLANDGGLSGAATNALIISGVQASDAGGYAVVVTNAAGAVTSAVASLTVVVPPQFIAMTWLPDKTLLVAFNAVSNLTYRIDASTDLVDWAILTNLPDPNGAVEFNDLDATNFSQRFYRAVWVP